MYQRQSGYSFNRAITPSVKLLLIINISIFLLQQVLGLFRLDSLFIRLFGLSHFGFFNKLMVWQIGSYMFLHGGWLHILFNSFALWMFGCELERLWGPKRFMQYYLISGVGAGLFIAIMNFFLTIYYGASSVPTIGASGAVYALLLAYGITWPNREVLVYFLFPIKMKYLVLIFGAIEFFGTLNTMAGVAGNISHIGHLGGIIAGFILINMFKRGSFSSNSKSKSAKGVVEDMLKARRLKKKRNAIEERKKAKEIIDRMLDKIGRSGVDSLSPEERRELEWARKHYYPGNDDIVH